MYQRILGSLENTRAEWVITDQVRRVARHGGAAIVLSHVADGVADHALARRDLREREAQPVSAP